MRALINGEYKTIVSLHKFKPSEFQVTIRVNNEEITGHYASKDEPIVGEIITIDVDGEKVTGPVAWSLQTLF